MLEKIKKEILEARKAKDSLKANLLNTLYSDAKTQSINKGVREPDNALLMNTLKKFVKNAKDTIELKEKSSLDNSQEIKELAILESFLPKQLSGEELEAIVKNYIEELPEKSKKFMGQIMKRLKEDHDGQFDGKTASGVVGKLLS